MIAIGTRDWQDYRVSTVVRPALVKAGGLAVRIQGLLRFYALQMTEQKTIRLLRSTMAQKPYWPKRPATGSYGGR